MKMYAFCTPSHLILKEEWFLPSLQDDYNLVFRDLEQIGRIEDHIFGSPQFRQTMLCKVELIIQAIRDNQGEVFVFSDVDIQFFRPFKDIVLGLMEGKDLLIQQNAADGELCSGFFVCRGNEKTLALWQDIKEYITQSQDKEDQHALNHFLIYRKRNRIIQYGSRCLREILNMAIRCNLFPSQSLALLSDLKNDYRIRWGYLPKEFFSPGIAKKTNWSPGIEFPIPADIIMHHANWTIGVENKIAQLRYVRDAVNKRVIPEANSFKGGIRPI